MEHQVWQGDEEHLHAHPAYAIAQSVQRDHGIFALGAELTSVPSSTGPSHKRRAFTSGYQTSAGQACASSSKLCCFLFTVALDNTIRKVHMFARYTELWAQKS